MIGKCTHGKSPWEYYNKEPGANNVKYTITTAPKGEGRKVKVVIFE